MEQKSFLKTLNKYLSLKSFSLYSIQGRIKMGFLVAITLISFQIVWTTLKLTNSYEVTNYYWNYGMPLKFHSQKLSSSVEEVKSNLLAYALHLDTDYLFKSKTIFTTDAKAAIDTLHNISMMINNKDSEILIKDLEDDYYKLKAEMDNLDNVQKYELEYYLVKKIYPIVAKIKEHTIHLVEEEELDEKKAKMELKEKLDNIKLTSGIVIIASVIVVVFFTFYILSALFFHLDKLKNYLDLLRQGDLPKNIIGARNEFSSVYHSLKILVHNLDSIEQFSHDVGKGKFDSEISVFENSGVLGQSLSEMRKSLKLISDQEEIRKWQNTGVSKLSAIIRGNHDDLSVLCDNLLEGLIGYTNANQGALYISNNENALEMVAAFAYGRKKIMKETIEKGHGLVGEVYRDGETLLITDVPKNYFKITSGLGKSLPVSLVIVPLKYQEGTIGALEMASFEVFTPQEIELLERVSEVFASAIVSTQNSQKTKMLLGEAQKNSKIMNEKEVRLRRSSEKLLAEKEETLLLFQAEQKKSALLATIINNDLFGLIVADDDGTILLMNHIAEHTFNFKENEAEGKNILKVIPGLKAVFDEEQAYKENETYHFQALTKGRFTIDVHARIGRVLYGDSGRWLVALVKLQETVDVE